MTGIVTDCLQDGEHVYVRVKVRTAEVPHLGERFELCKVRVAEFESGQQWQRTAYNRDLDRNETRTITLQFRIPGQPSKWEATGGKRRTTISDTTLRKDWRRVS